MLHMRISVATKEECEAAFSPGGQALIQDAIYRNLRALSSLFESPGTTVEGFINIGIDGKELLEAAGC